MDNALLSDTWMINVTILTTTYLWIIILTSQLNPSGGMMPVLVGSDKVDIVGYFSLS